MGRLSEKELNDLVKKKQNENSEKKDVKIRKEAKDVELPLEHKSLDKTPLSDSEIKELATKIIGDKKSQVYSIIDTYAEKHTPPIPKIITSEYPHLKIKGIFPAHRQERCVSLRVLKEIELILEEKTEGNLNATINFLMWVGLQTLKNSAHKKVNINVNAGTYADGKLITEYQEMEGLS